MKATCQAELEEVSVFRFRINNLITKSFFFRWFIDQCCVVTIMLTTVKIENYIKLHHVWSICNYFN